MLIIIYYVKLDHALYLINYGKKKKNIIMA